MIRFRSFYKSLGLSRQWFVKNTNLSYECIRYLDSQKKKNFKISTILEIYEATKGAFGVGALPGDYLEGEIWAQCRSKYYSEIIAEYMRRMEITE